MISLGYDDVSLGEAVGPGEVNPVGPGGEYCRVCRAASQERAEAERDAARRNQPPPGKPIPDIQMAVAKDHLLSRGQKGGGDLDVIAVPYVFRYLCTELAAMGIAISVQVQ